MRYIITRTPGSTRKKDGILGFVDAECAKEKRRDYTERQGYDPTLFGKASRRGKRSRSRNLRSGNLGKRKAMLAKLRERLEIETLSVPRKTSKKPERLVMAIGDILVYPTERRLI
jgi:hypothetical protein